MPTAKLTSKGQITVPTEVRRALAVDTGDRVAFRIRADGVVEMWAENVDVAQLFGVLRPKVKGITVERMKRDIAKAAQGDRS